MRANRGSSPATPSTSCASKGEAEEGYINLSHQKAQRMHDRDDIEESYDEKKPDQGRRD